MSGSLGGDRYITPEYLAPLPQKDGHTDKSPLQMLAQTCSQIGADSGPKMADKQKTITATESKTSKIQHPKSGSSPTIIVSDSSSKPVSFKPYEITKENGTSGKIESRKSSVTSSEGGKVAHSSNSPLGGTRSPSSRETETGLGRRETSPLLSSSSETTPTLSTGMEILAGHPKDLPLGTFRPPVGGSLDHLNPAFRLSGLGPLPGYPPTSSSVAGSVCRDPYCKDPNCPTAVYNAYMARLSAARGLPPGYMELMEAHKMMAMGGLGGLNPPQPPTSTALGPGGAYICNWMNGRDYCGKRFTSAEELLVHLKTHTNLSASESGMLGGPGTSPGAYAGLLGASMMGRGAAPGGPVLPSSMGLGASRYSPYQRPAGSSLPPSLSGLPGFPPGSLAGLHPSFASLAGYPASLYALYGARL